MEDEHLKNIKCSKCGSNRLKMAVDRSFTKGYIKCEECGNFDTRKIINGEISDLITCDICGSSTTEIIAPDGYDYPGWIYPKLENLDIEVICDKCKDEHLPRLIEKDEEISSKHPTIMYMFDGDELKWWNKRDEDCNLLGKIELDEYSKDKYDRALREMKREFKKETIFVDIDEE